MTCEHAQNPGPDGIEYQDAVWCGLKNDSYSFGCCRGCPDNTTQGRWPPASAFVPLRIDPAVRAAIRKQQGNCHGCGDSPVEP